MIVPFVPKPGFQRDGVFVSKHGWQEGQWTRFQYGLPRKMGGCQYLWGDGGTHEGWTVNSVPRGIALFSIENTVETDSVFNCLLVGTKDKLLRMGVDNKGSASRVIKVDLGDAQLDDNTLWQFDSFTVNNVDDKGELVPQAYLLAFPGKNANNIQSNKKSAVYYGKPDDLAFKPLYTYTVTYAPDDKGHNTPIYSKPEALTVSGGVVVLYPYIFLYGSAGEVIILDTGQPREVAPDPSKPTEKITCFKVVEHLSVASSKIVAAKVMRGGGNSPSALFWTLDSLIRVSFYPTSGDEAPFRFDVISDQISILSSNSVMEYDGVFFWAATNRFLMYDGLVREIPNTQNLNYFTDTLSFENRQKVWATKIPRYGEIWWFYVSAEQVGTKINECDRALIYNIREKCWYDTKLPSYTTIEDGNEVKTQTTRSCGCYTQNFASPIWGEGSKTGTNNYYSLWEHERGLDQVFKAETGSPPPTQPIKAYIKTAPFSWVVSGTLAPGIQSQNKAVMLDRVELDIEQQGEMKLTVSGSRFTRDKEVVSQTQKDNGSGRIPIDDEGGYYFTPEKIKLDIREQRRQMMLKFESNVLGGDFIFGVNLLWVAIGDHRP